MSMFGRIHGMTGRTVISLVRIYIETSLNRHSDAEQYVLGSVNYTLEPSRGISRDDCMGLTSSDLVQ